MKIERKSAIKALGQCVRLESGLQAKRSIVAKVAVMEAIQKAETGDAVKSGWGRRDTDGTDVLGKPKRGNLHQKNVGRESTRVGAAKRYRLIRVSTAEQAIVLFQDEFEGRHL